MVQQGVEQNGQLGEHPLAELIRETSVAGLSGAFRLAREHVKTVIYLDAGEIVFAVSNLKLHRLAECARRWNFVTAQQLAGVGRQTTDAETGAALVRSGGLTTESLAELQSLQAADVLRTALLWTDGAWSFDPRVRLATEMRARVPLRELLTESARRLPADFIVNRFGNTNETLSLDTNPATEFEMQPVEAFVLSRFDAGDIRVHELLAVSGLPEAETLRAVYALAFGGLLRRDHWLRAFTDETVARFQAAAAATKKAEQAAAQTEPAVRQTPVLETPRPPEATPEVDERAELEQFFSRLDAAEDHYEVLAVTRSAEANAIKQAYYNLARRFHPDRFHQEAGTQMHARLQTAFARVAQAYEALRDAKTRAAYDVKMQTQRKMRHGSSFSSSGQAGQTTAGTSSTASGPMQAEESFQRGLGALKSGNLALAMSLLGEAARLAPKQPRYRAYYGLSLSANSKTRHQAEAEIQAAIALDANNASYRVMLAELYHQLGMKRRALGELQRAMSLDPQNAEARRLLGDLNSKG